ncbi:ComF family protein [Pseudodesulfovibrio sp. zrk46]|uniref:ComF family protein n=1 Tax=Pseudodesulfovibrio sp. zrk46 TaxID=2725288 RepID=UPI001448C558|nr:ComF family protein [Pseudodesulfovibrio sp. zrk46]QJB56999.1 ComF family protein [Pseudodesulfovibrio sp. zrk46]
MFRLLHRLACRAGFVAGRCPVCSRLTDTSTDHLCPECADSLAPRSGGYCPGCGEIFGEEDSPPTLCSDCRHTREPWDNFHFHNIYAGTLRDLILGYKFHSGVGHTHLLAELAYNSFIEGGGETPDLIVPVPLHTKRLLWRGFNQSAELCRRLSKKMNRPIAHDALVRTRHTQPQTRLGMVERQTNIKDAFRADPEMISRKSVLVVDDVYTTGATLRECTITLRRAGAAQVDVLVLARAMQ